jgi:hypothetical protein
MLMAIVGLSLAVWVAFYLLTPDAPLSPPETLFVVGACAAVAYAARWIWQRVRGSSGRDEPRP